MGSPGRAVIACFESGPGDHQPYHTFKFRGKFPYFWKRTLFQSAAADVIDLSAPGGHTPAWDVLLVFNHRTFPSLTPGSAETFLRQVLQNFQRHRPEAAFPFFSVEGLPFFAVHRQVYLDWREAAGEGDFYSHLKEGKETNPVMLEGVPPVQCLDIARDFREIDRFVTGFQASELLKSGVELEDYFNFYIEGLPPIGQGTRIATGVVIKGDSRVGENTVLSPHAYIEDSEIGDGCMVLPGCVMTGAHLEKGVTIGPYTHLRPGSRLKQGSKAGNFVEMKKSVLGEGSKANHLSYIGDCLVGEKVNIGAGTITCNYDGKNKHRTVIEDNAFIGSGTELVAPITIRKNSYVAAGSTVTEEVPPDSLAVARQKQRNLVGWVERKRKREQLKKCDP